MEEKSILEYSDLSNSIQMDLVDHLEAVAFERGFDWKTPPYDLARRLMNHIVGFKQANLFEEGG